MEIEEVRQLSKRWYENIGPRVMEYAPEARFVTGDLRIDLALHHFEKDSGMRVKLKSIGTAYRIEQYEIVDEAKFAWFLLEWT